MPFELFVAIRYLLARRKQVVISVVSLISMVGVAAGVMALIVALALNSGFQKEFQERILSATTHITLLQIRSRAIQGYDTLADQLGAIENVAAVSPTVYSQSLLQSDLGRSQGVYIRGIDPGRPQFMGGLLGQITEGDAASFGQQSSVPQMMVGEDLAEALGLLVGDQVVALGMRGELAPFPIGRSVRRQRFKIAAIFKSGLWEFDANWALIPLGEAQLFEGMSDQEVSALEFQLHDIYQADVTAEEVRSRAGKTFTTRTWMELNRPLFSALQLEKLALFIAIGLIVMVASFEHHHYPDHDGDGKNRRHCRHCGHGRTSLNHPPHLSIPGSDHRCGWNLHWGNPGLRSGLVSRDLPGNRPGQECLFHILCTL